MIEYILAKIGIAIISGDTILSALDPKEVTSTLKQQIAKFSRAYLQREWFEGEGKIDPDLAYALSVSYFETIKLLKQQWCNNGYFQQLSKTERAQTLEVFERLEKLVDETFLNPQVLLTHLGKSSIALSDLAGEAISEADILPDLIEDQFQAMFVQQSLGKLWTREFHSILKEEKESKVWRAYQILWQEQIKYSLKAIEDNQFGLELRPVQKLVGKEGNLQQLSLKYLNALDSQLVQVRQELNSNSAMLAEMNLKLAELLAVNSRFLESERAQIRTQINSVVTQVLAAREISPGAVTFKLEGENIQLGLGDGDQRSINFNTKTIFAPTSRPNLGVYFSANPPYPNGYKLVHDYSQTIHESELSTLLLRWWWLRCSIRTEERFLLLQERFRCHMDYMKKRMSKGMFKSNPHVDDICDLDISQNGKHMAVVHRLREKKCNTSASYLLSVSDKHGEILWLEDLGCGYANNAPVIGFSPRGRFIVCYGGTSLPYTSVFDIEKGTMWNLPSHPRGRLHFTREDSLVIYSLIDDLGMSTYVMYTESFTSYRMILQGGRPLLIMPDGRRLLTIRSIGRFTTWDITTGQQVKSILSTKDKYWDFNTRRYIFPEADFNILNGGVYQKAMRQNLVLEIIKVRGDSVVLLWNPSSNKTTLLAGLNISTQFQTFSFVNGNQSIALLDYQVGCNIQFLDITQIWK